MESQPIANLIEKGLALVRIENESSQLIAVQRPRDEAKVEDRVLAELARSPEFASKSFYVIPYTETAEDGSKKKVEVTGLSIHAARSIARVWGNVAVRVRFVEETATAIVLEGAVVDYETNFRSAKERKVSKSYYSKKTKTVVPLREDRLLQAIEAGSSKVERNLLLSVFPVALREEYYRRAMSIASGIEKGGKKGSLKSRVDSMFAKFASEFQVDRDRILQYLDVADATKVTEDMVGRMVGIFNAINDGERKVADVFPVEKEEDDSQAAGVDIVDAMLADEEGRGGRPPTTEDPPKAVAGEASKPNAEVDIIRASIRVLKSTKSIGTIVARISAGVRSKLITVEDADRLTDELDKKETELRDKKG